MTPYYTDDLVTLWHGDCLHVLRTLPDNSVDSVVTDPPAGISFMGKGWDHDLGGRDRWVEWHEDRFAEMLRVLKPGGHALVWAMPRTSHWTGTALEQAGWEIRDQIVHMFGSGFPKSHDIGKAIDKAAGAEREVVGKYTHPATGKPHGDFATDGQRDSYGSFAMCEDARDITAPATPEAATWDGWGTALKPAMEIWWLARKPLTGTVAANVLAWGVGGINVDGCRINPGEEVPGGGGLLGGAATRHEGWQRESHANGSATEPHAKGRWPANVILDDTAAALLDQQSGERPGAVSNSSTGQVVATTFGKGAVRKRTPGRGDSGGASRFFYTPKADRHERPHYYRPTCECEDSWPTTSHARAIADPTTADCSSTSKSGNVTTADQSPTATRSTTSTATNSTTTPPTSSRSPQPSTSASTVGANSATANGGSPAPSAKNSSPSLPTTGTSAAKGGRSTAGAVPATSPKWSKTSVCGRCGAPSRREAHATVKPVDLMAYLVRLVTPRGGTVLDPFAGTGTTAEAATAEGCKTILIERESDYLPLIVQRLQRPVEVTLW